MSTCKASTRGRVHHARQHVDCYLAASDLWQRVQQDNPSKDQLTHLCRNKRHSTTPTLTGDTAVAAGQLISVKVSENQATLGRCENVRPPMHRLEDFQS